VHRNAKLTLVLLSTFCAPALASAQEPYSPLVPRGKIRLEIRGEFSSFSSRYRIWTDGTATREGLEELSDPFSGIAGVRVFPFLAPVQEAVRQAGNEDYDLSLGTMASFMEMNAARAPIALDVGIFDWLTAGVVVPAVQNEAEFAFHFEADSSGANAGVGPGAGEASAFVTILQHSIGQYDTFREATCASDPGSPACLNATAVLEDALGFGNALAAMYETGFAPLGWSPTGMALHARLSDLGAEFGEAGVTGFPTAIPLADAFLTSEDFLRLVTDPAFGIAATNPMGSWRGLWGIGDIELRASARLFESGESGGSSHLVGGGGALVRLPAGTQGDPANILDAGTGDAQTDVELRGWINARWQGRLGVWADFRYGIQLKGNAERRVFDPDFTFAPLSSQVKLDWDPGDYQSLELAPWYRVAESMTLLAGFHHYRKGRDSFALATGDATQQPPAGPVPDPEILVPHSEVSSSRLMVGMVYNRATPTWDGKTGRPLEIRVVYRRVVGGRGGNVPNSGAMEAGFRFFAGLWGEG